MTAPVAISKNQAATNSMLLMLVEDNTCQEGRHSIWASCLYGEL